METLKTQALVIGAGPGGYPCAIRLGQLGVGTLVVERDKPGGVCLNVGCIPSKALIGAAKLLDKMRHGDEMGLLCDSPRVDMDRLIGWKEELVGKLTSGVRQLLKANHAEYRTGEASFVSPREVEVRDARGAVRIQAEHVVIATGSRPVEIPGFRVDEKRILSSTGALALRAVPARLVVIGGGYIGLELGMMFAKLGSKVAVVEATPALLPGTDPELVQVVARKMKQLGIEVHLEAKAVSDDGQGAATIQPKQGGTLRLDADKVLVTVGRRPNSEGLGLEKIGVRVDPKGFVVVDERLRTSVPGVYAIGDVAGQPMLAHKASKEGEVCAEVIAGKAAAMDVRAIPAVIFTDPEIATCGLSEPEAVAKKVAIKVGRFPLAALGRALSLREPEGFVKIVLDAETRQVLGIHIVGANASDLISEAALALEMGAMAEDIALTIHPHPTLPEGIMEAAKAALGEAIHIVNRKDA